MPTIRIALTGDDLQLAEAIIALLREHDALGCFYIAGPRPGDDDGACFTAFWEGTNAAPYFSLDHCNCRKGAAAYEPYEAMSKLLASHGARAENTWAASPIFRED